MTVENQVVLKADEGKFLTNGQTFGKVVYLGKNDSADNWHEVDGQDYQIITVKDGQSVSAPSPNTTSESGTFAD